MNLLFRTSNLSDWISVAQRLQKEIGWCPKYWLAHPELEDSVQNTFPDAIFHSKWDARRHKHPIDIKNRDNISLDKPLLERFRPYRHTVLRLMDRMDPGNAYSYDERVRSYHKLLQYWLYVIEECEIDAAIFARAPHGTAGYTIYSICQEKGIPTVLFKPVHQLPGLNLSQSTVHGANERLIDLYESDFDTLSPENITKTSKKAVEKLTGEYREPSYMSRNEFSFSSKLWKLLKSLKHIKKLPKRVKTHDKRKYKTIECSDMTLAEQLAQSQIAKYKKKRLHQAYRKRSITPDLSRQYVYVPLHYQPERTTTPDGDVFGNQYLMIDLLSKAVPDDWKIFVKEHPTQFSPRSIGERGRHIYQYNDINELNNVSLINNRFDSFELIDSAEATATVTGTVGWESVVRGTPAIIFGNAWYRLCPGVYYTTTLTEVEIALNEIKEKETVSYEKVLRFVRAVEVAGYRGYQSSNWKDANSISNKTNIYNLSSEILSCLFDTEG